MDKEPNIEQGSGGGVSVGMSSTITLQQAIEYGEYKPEYLATFAEWFTLSRHIQFQLIRKAIDIRHRQLMSQYAELNNALDMSKKHDVQMAMKNVERQLNALSRDKEELYIEYSK